MKKKVGKNKGGKKESSEIAKKEGRREIRKMVGRRKERKPVVEHQQFCFLGMVVSQKTKKQYFYHPKILN